MTFLTLFAAIHQLFGDVFALLAVIGCALMMLSPFSDADAQVKRWGIGGLILSSLGQISMMLTATHVEKIGIFLRLTPQYINGLLFLSFGLLVLRGWLRSNRYRFM